MIESMAREVSANLPFVLESFQAAVEKTTSNTKSEIAAFASNIATITGIERLKEIGFETKEPELLEK